MRVPVKAAHSINPSSYVFGLECLINVLFKTFLRKHARTTTKINTQIKAARLLWSVQFNVNRAEASEPLV